MCRVYVFFDLAQNDIAMNNQSMCWINNAIDDIDNTWIRSLSYSYDYFSMRKRTQWLREELQAYLFSPVRIQRWIESGRELDDYLNEFVLFLIEGSVQYRYNASGLLLFEYFVPYRLCPFMGGVYRLRSSII